MSLMSPKRVSKPLTRKSAKGQGLVEFAFVSIILFGFILGIIEMGRFLFTYSVVTNAAQEGSRYGIIRPRDAVVSGAEATQVAATMAAMGTPTYIPQLVASGSGCSITGKAREKAIGVPASQVRVTTWYDNGDGTPIAATNSNIDNTVKEGNRVIVEASYNFKFVVPFIDKFVPNGIVVKMRSARTILQNGKSTAPTCSVNLTPAPTSTSAGTDTPTETPQATATPYVPTTSTNTPSVTATASPSATATAPAGTPTNTATGTPPTSTATRTASPTATATGTPTPKVLTISNVQVLAKNGNGKPIRIHADITINGTTIPASEISKLSFTADVTQNGSVYVTGKPLDTQVAANTWSVCPAADIRTGDVISVVIHADPLPAYVNEYQSATSPSVLGVRDNNFSCP